MAQSRLKGGTAAPAKKQTNNKEYDDNGRGAIFEVTSDNPAAPIFSGFVYINPDDYEADNDTGLVKVRLALWEKTSQKGDVYYSVKAEPEQNK